MCFNGGVDVQGTLIHGSPQDVNREVDKLVDPFGEYDGGYIGGTSHSIMRETPLDNVIALYEAFVEYQSRWAKEMNVMIADVSSVTCVEAIWNL